MSSILKALKKLEQEESRDSKETTAWPDSVHSARKSIQEKSRRRFIVTALIPFCCVLIAGFVYFGNNKTVPKTNVEKVTIKRPRSTPKPTTKPVTFDLTKLKKISEFTATLPKNVLPKKESNKTEVSPEAMPESSAVEASIDRDPEPEIISAVTEKKEDLPEIAFDSRLKIQAIAWALEPSRRFVVINNSIVREGGNIDGITVVSIEDNIVHFNENGKEWRQRFVIR